MEWEESQFKRKNKLTTIPLSAIKYIREGDPFKKQPTIWLLCSDPCGGMSLSLRKYPSPPNGLYLLHDLAPVTSLLCLLLLFPRIVLLLLVSWLFPEFADMISPQEIYTFCSHNRECSSLEAYGFLIHSLHIFAQILSSGWGLPWSFCWKLQTTSLPTLSIPHLCFSILHIFLLKKSLSLSSPTRIKAPWGKGLFCLFYLLLYCRT